MNTYEIRLVVNGCEISQSRGSGNNAIEAFENSMADGSTFIPFGFSGEVVIINNSGLAFKFEVCQAQ